MKFLLKAGKTVLGAGDSLLEAIPAFPVAQSLPE